MVTDHPVDFGRGAPGRLLVIAFLGIDVLGDKKIHILTFWIPASLCIIIPILLNILFPPMPSKARKTRPASEWFWEALGLPSTHFPKVITTKELELLAVWGIATLFWIPVVALPFLFWDKVGLYEHLMGFVAIFAGFGGSASLVIYFIRVIRLNHYEDKEMEISSDISATTFLVDERLRQREAGDHTRGNR